ncbi:DNA polymerase IV [Ruania zhangjianzhongii]|uniref:DNA polymerase IV n=1 Tax=Ruania zhangjianzhongii TaxID=2603206 RepID=UPI0011C8034E|nr:DNA polymerase IV [Ruania zhangjianzhongii]
MSRGPRSAAARRDWGGDDSQTPILHVDMDAFFASVELIDRPELRGKPVIVGGQHRGVVLAATYEARASGVHSAMPMTRARVLCPQAVVISPDHHRYREISRGVMAILAEVTPVMEPLSIDEAFLDVSGARRRLGAPAAIARRLRERIAAELRVPASVGVAATKFVAKLASSHAKPDGLLVIPKEATVPFLHSLPVGALWGVGERTAERLSRLAIHTVADLAHTPPATLQQAIGRSGGQRLFDLAWGRDPRPVEPVHREKSIGHEQTFGTNLLHRADLAAVLLDQAHRCAARLRGGALLAGGVSIKVRYADFTTLTRSRSLEAPSDVAHQLYLVARELLAGVRIPPDGIRLLGLRCDALSDSATTAVQGRLDEDDTGRRLAEQAMDDVRQRYGVGSLTVGSLVRGTTTENGSGDIS